MFFCSRRFEIKELIYTLAMKILFRASIITISQNSRACIQAGVTSLSSSCDTLHAHNAVIFQDTSHHITPQYIALMPITSRLTFHHMRICRVSIMPIKSPGAAAIAWLAHLILSRVVALFYCSNFYESKGFITFVRSDAAS